jgi:hypothetical protein
MMKMLCILYDSFTRSSNKKEKDEQSMKNEQICCFFFSFSSILHVNDVMQERFRDRQETHGADDS